MKRYSYRDKRLGKLVYNEISLIINYELDDMFMEYVNVTDVQMTKDLSLAKIYFVSTDKNIDVMDLKKHLDKAKNYIRSLLNDRLSIKRLPQLEFIIDETIIYSERVEKLIDELNKSH
jgi:ribosome-binding factor A